MRAVYRVVSLVDAFDIRGASHGERGSMADVLSVAALFVGGVIAFMASEFARMRERVEEDRLLDEFGGIEQLQ